MNTEPEITEYDIKQGEIVFNVFKDKIPELILMEYMVKSVGWKATLLFMNNEHWNQIPEKVRDLNVTCLKYLHHKYQIESKNN